MNVLALGGSRNIGYLSALRLLRKEAYVTFLLRDPSCFDSDKDMQPFIKTKHAILVKGDALQQADIEKAISAANEATGASLDAVIFTVGGTPSFSLTKGFSMPIPDLCTRAMLSLLAALRSNPQLVSSPPKLIAVTSMGIGEGGHENVPTVLKPLHNFMLTSAHEDKLGVERVLTEAAGLAWTEGEVKASVLSSGWEASVGEKGWLKDQIVVIRPSLLTNGKAKGDQNGKSEPYRVDAKELPKAYMISRNDVAHCIVEKVLQHWEEYRGKTLRITN